MPRHTGALLGTVKPSPLASGVALALAAGALAFGSPGPGSAAARTGESFGTSSRASPEAARSRVVELRLRRAVRRLPVANEMRRGYDRDRFRHWIDANGDCQDTRDEVLDAESRVAVSGCSIDAGEWRSYYDGEVWTDSSDVDIDHVVALAEAWDSGARRWNATTRRRYANDLADARTLVAVTDNVNQSKSDQDPAEWLPALNKCRYVRQWVAVKLRWSLTVDRPEKRALRRRVSSCSNAWVRVSKARIGH